MNILTRVLAGLILFTPAALAAPPSYDLDLIQGFRFADTNTRTVGYLTALQFGNTSLPTDLSVRDPVTMKQLSVVGVLDQFNWTGGSAAPKQIAFNLSAAGRSTILALLRDPSLPVRDIKVSYSIFEYDTFRKKYFTALKPQTATLNARLLVNGGDVQLEVGANPDNTVPTPANFKANISLIPGRGDQFDLRATKWGMTPSILAWIHEGPRFQ